MQNSSGPGQDANGFQARSSRIGKAFEDECATLLERLGFHDIERHPSFSQVGVEVDLAALTVDGYEVVFECKATNAESKRPGGMADTDNVKKAIADAFLLTMVKDKPPYVVLTTHTPAGGRARAMVNAALESEVFLAVVDVHNDHAGVGMLRDLAADAHGFFFGSGYTPVMAARQLRFGGGS